MGSEKFRGNQEQTPALQTVLPLVSSSAWARCLPSLGPWPAGLSPLHPLAPLLLPSAPGQLPPLCHLLTR